MIILFKTWLYGFRQNTIVFSNLQEEINLTSKYIRKIN